MKIKLWIGVVSFAVLLLICGFAVRGILDQRAKRRRQAGYQAILREYSSTLKSGMARSDVESWLRLRGRTFQQTSCCENGHHDTYADLLIVGKEDPPWFCRQSSVYVVLEFESPGPPGVFLGAQRDDVLQRVSLDPRLEGCL
jgi:hypothetical protein